MPGKYATQTEVTVEKSKQDIENLLKRYNADQFIYGWEETRAVIGFRIRSRQVRVYLPIPTPKDPDIVRDPAGRLRNKASLTAALAQANRQRWRALLLVIKAKLEAVECGISTIEREFLADTVMHNGQTVHEWAEPQIQQMYLSGKMPALLPGPRLEP